VRSSARKARGGLFAPPLRVWIAAAAVFALLFILSASAFWDLRYNEKPFMEDSRKRLEALSERDKKGLRVVAIGSSLFRRAIFFDGRMEAFAADNGFSGLEFLRITRPGCEIKDFEPFFDRVLDARPDVLLIESDALFFVRPRRDFFREYPDFMRHVLLKSMSSKRLVFPRFAVQEIDGATDLPVITEGLGTAQMNELGLRNLKQRLPAEGLGANALLQKAAAMGIRLVIVDMRREPGFEKFAGIERAQTAALAKNLPAEYGAALISHPEELGREYYWDYAHLNEEGRRRFSLWLLGALKGMGGALKGMEGGA